MDNDDDGHDDDEDDDDADDAHVGGTDALSWELMLSLRTENKQQRPHHDDDNDIGYWCRASLRSDDDCCLKLIGSPENQ